MKPDTPHRHMPHPWHGHIHPQALTADVTRTFHDKMLDWISEHLLASSMVFDVAFIGPLLALPAPDSVKITMGLISGTWFQWWALPAIQRQQYQADLKREAKAMTDHRALTYIGHQIDHAVTLLESIHGR